MIRFVCIKIPSDPDCTESRIARKAYCTHECHLLKKYETSTLTCFVKPRDILNFKIRYIFKVQSYNSYNPGFTHL